MARRAVHAYVENDLHVRFVIYREQCGLSTDAALLSLLVLREIKLRRLAQKMDGSAADPAHPTEARTAKITTNIDQGSRDAFFALAGGLSRSASACAADLVERELQERWLFLALEWCPAP